SKGRRPAAGRDAQLRLASLDLPRLREPRLTRGSKNSPDSSAISTDSRGRTPAPDGQHGGARPLA
ncbi:hypothetical protein Dimus_028518, partial [Dionaea muscipula]